MTAYTELDKIYSSIVQNSFMENLFFVRSRSGQEHFGIGSIMTFMNLRITLILAKQTLRCGLALKVHFSQIT